MTIGDNVFIGTQATILKGVHIGNNVIIGANSLVNKDIPDNSVAAGNPCKVIATLDEYYEKRKNAQVKEATEMVSLYRKCYGKEVGKQVLREFFWLFENNPDNLPKEWKSVNRLCYNERFTNEVMRRNKKKYNNMNSFLESIYK